MEFDALLAAAEAILFASAEPVAPDRLARALGVDPGAAEKLITLLSDAYDAAGRGLRVARVGGGYSISTRPEYADSVRAFVSAQKKRQLTQALLETLAIVAYRQPVTKAEIEEIRGVNADHAVNKLMEYGLVVEKGRLDAPYKPLLFGTSDEFLRYFGFSGLDALPALTDDEESLLLAAEREAEGISPESREIRQGKIH
ncbi:MAG: SMC-Scp complex subunit ScpB [Clostridiales bacterium]|jgi:segregation and condensation protein B|nr:SMC-Scp complex subunit ScpB [Clostridiales bacterium]